MADYPKNASRRKLLVTTARYSSALLLLLYSMSAFAIYSVTPASLDFGGIGVGASSGVMTVTFTNQNTSDLIDLTSITATGDFSIVNNCPAILAETFSCTIDVMFNPTTSGPLTGSLNIDGFDRSITLGMSYLPISATVSLSGTGLRGDLVIGSNIVDLGAVPLDTASQSVPVTLSNSGNAPVNISTIAATAPFAQTSDCPASLAAGTNCTIMVNVTATTLGPQSGTLTTSGTGPQGTTT